ncbi:hypothetical protein [Vibrio crassostreae]|uniref:hypothetical protein n=1 Tax=Vibrio crassostreae TaxID=246167 RepID=UPI001B3068E7|nr:hypothetical protein [Vibrio crassostreae]
MATEGYNNDRNEKREKELNHREEMLQAREKELEQEAYLNQRASRLEREYQRKLSATDGLKSKVMSAVIAGLLALGGVSGYGVHSSVLNEDNISENTHSVYQNSNKLNELQLQVSQLELVKQFPESSGVGMCSCIKKDNSSVQSVKICPTQNGVCDTESRTICEGVFGPEYEC